MPSLPLRGSAGLTALQAGGIGLLLELHMLDVWRCSRDGMVVLVFPPCKRSKPATLIACQML